MTEPSFHWPVRVYYEDTDAGGIVYHARYLYYLERARTEWLRQSGYNQGELKQQGVIFVVHSMNIKWISPAKLDDQLQVNVRIDKVKKASIQFEQTITLAGQQKLSATVLVACLNTSNMKPSAIPSEILQNMNNSLSKEPINGE